MEVKSNFVIEIQLYFSLYCKTIITKSMKRVSIINYDVLWDRISDFARKTGRVTIRPVLLLFYVMKSKDTPLKDKMLILSTLSYIVLPIDILDAKRLPIIGWFDEMASLSVTLQKVRRNITPEMEAKVEAILDGWFPDYTQYELIEES